VQGLDRLDVLGGVGSVLGVGCIGKGAAVHVVDDGAGALVAALTCAVDGCNVLVSAVVQGINGLQEAVSAPGMLVGINVLVSAHFLDLGHVHGHAVCGHAQGILIVVAGSVLAGGLNGLVDVLLSIVGPQVVQRSHNALCAPVCNQTLGTFHDQIRCAAALDGGVHLIVAVGVVQILHSDLDVRILCVEAGNQTLNGVVVAPAADGVCPQLDAGGRSSCACSGACGCGRSSGGRAGRTAAGGQSAGCAQNASGLQERTAGNAVFHSSFSFAFKMLHVVGGLPCQRPLLMAPL